MGDEDGVIVMAGKVGTTVVVTGRVMLLFNVVVVA